MPARRSDGRSGARSGGRSGGRLRSLPDSAFAFPGLRKEPLVSASHVRNALARFDQVEGADDVGRRPGLQPDPHPHRPPAQHHGERHVTDREPLSGGERNAEVIAGRVAAAADSVSAHIVLGAGDQHILGAVAKHLPGSLGPVTVIAAGPLSTDSDEQLSHQIAAALDEITGEAIAAAGDLVASAAAGPAHGAVRGIEAVSAQLAEQQVGVLLVAADIGQDGDELVWAALRQDAFVVQLPDRSGSLAAEPAAALLRRGAAG